MDPRIHPRLIGARGKSLRALMAQFPGVDVRFPGTGSEDSSMVSVSGPPKVVEACEDRLRAMADEFVSHLNVT